MMKTAKLIAVIAAFALLTCCAPATGGDGSETAFSADIPQADSFDADAEISDGAVSADTSGSEAYVINSGGEYVFEGDVSGGIVVDAKGEEVQLIFKGVTVTSGSGAPVNIRKAEKVVITLADGTENYVSDPESYTYDDEEKEEPSAAIFSKSDLTINGGGSLTVDASFNDGIVSKDVLRIVSGNITVKSEDDGLVGRDAVIIDSGSLSVVSGGDALKSTNDEDTALGYIHVTDGVFSIEAGCDGLQGETSVSIDGGEFSILTGSGSKNASYSERGWNEEWGNWQHTSPVRSTYSSDKDSQSAKAVKAGMQISITGGNILIDSSDDSIHSNGNLYLSGGNVTMSSGDDGIHADSALNISGGNITVGKSYEGIEATDILISGGNINVCAADDGINGAGGNDSSASGGRPGENRFSSDKASFNMTGGILTVDSSGDGIDINGSGSITGGEITVYGSDANDNGALDYDGDFEISGGRFAAFGSSGMLQGFTGGSQASFAQKLSEADGGCVITVEDESGNVIFSAEIIKSCSAMIFSSDELQTGKTYTVCSWEDGEKTELKSFEQSSLTVGEKGHGHMGMPGRP